jgi:hypothetical protein
MDARGVPLSFCERRAVNKQKSEGLVAAAVDFGMTAFASDRLRAVDAGDLLDCLTASDPVAEIHRAGLAASARAVRCRCAHIGQASNRHTVGVRIRS